MYIHKYIYNWINLQKRNMKENVKFHYNNWCFLNSLEQPNKPRNSFFYEKKKIITDINIYTP